MKVGRLLDAEQNLRIGAIDGDVVRLAPPETQLLEQFLEADDPRAALEELLAGANESMPLSDAQWLAPIDLQEVWAAGVTYKRSMQARMDESEHAASFYDKVYAAARPELFFKATPNRVSGPGEPVRVRGDSRWTVPEPELALVLNSRLELVGYTIGNDMSARDIEGENPLYLPQAKVYDGCAALGPTITLVEDLPPAEKLTIELVIERRGQEVFRGATSLASMNRDPIELVEWLARDNAFPNGVILLTGTGVVPPDDFSLTDGDVVTIDIAGVGRLTNPVVKAG